HSQLASQAQWDKVAVISGYHDRPIFTISSCVGLPQPVVTSGGGDDKICLFTVKSVSDNEDDPEPLELASVIPNAHAGEVNCLAWSSDLNPPLLASAGDDHIVKLWSLTD
ncbi:hypothetical protein BVRB_021730, partial [Beta vulgaris subsp. vulgaris]